MNKSSFLILIIFLLIATSAQSETTVYGFHPAYFENEQPFLSEHRLPIIEYEMIVKVVIDLSAAGKVVSHSVVNPADSKFNAYLEKYIHSLNFMPATFDDKPVESKLLFEAMVFPKMNIPLFYFPLDLKGSVADHDMFVETMKLNEIAPPKIISFPPVTADLKNNIDSLEAPFSILKIELDTAGRVLDVVVEKTTYPDFIDQLVASVRYADISPLTINGSPKNATVYLQVSYFREVIYPTKVYNDSTISGYPHFKAMLKMVHVKTELLRKPISKFLSYDKYSLNDFGINFHTPISLYIEIDTLGKSRISRSSEYGQKRLARLREFVRRLEFYPAIDFEGKYQNYYGLIQLISQEGADIRINYLWFE